MPLGIFSIPKTSTRSCCPEAIDAAPSWRAAPPEAQPGLHVVDGDAGAGQCPDHPVAGGHAAVGGAADRPPGRPGSRCPPRPTRPAPPPRPWRSRSPLEPTEGMEPDPGDAHVAHVRNTQVSTGSPSGPGTSSPSRWTRHPGANPFAGQAGDDPQHR